MKNRNRSNFLELMKCFICTYLPDSIGATPNTVVSYKTAFRLLIVFMYEKKGVPADALTFGMLDCATLSEFLTWIETERKCSASTKNQRLSALLSFSEYAQNQDFDAACVFRSSLMKLPMKKARHKKRAVFTVEEVRVLLALPNECSKIGMRDKVLLCLMYASGARAQEMCDLTVRDIQYDEKGAILDIKGKGGKARRIKISGRSAAILKRYLQYRKITGQPDRHIFSSQTNEQMSVSCVEAIFKKYVRMAKESHPTLYPEDSYPPHSMRHSTASHMLEAGVPIIVLKNFLGHSSLQTTQIYAELSQNTIDRHLKEWNEKWFPKDIALNPEHTSGNKIPEFLS